MTNNILLKNSNTIDHEGKIKLSQDIFIENGKIAQIGILENKEADETIDCTNFYITPGLVNLHTHSGMNIFKGIAEDVCIEKWFNDYIWPYESKMTPKESYWGTMLAIYEMIDNGVTAFADHYFNAEMIVKAAKETGIRLDLAITLFGMNNNFNTQLENASSLISKENGNSELIKVRMGPHSPYTCSPEQLKIINSAAKNLDVGIHIHISETEQQVKDSIKNYNLSPLQVLKESGGLDLPHILAHALWITEEEISLLNENSYIAICPKTYMKLAMGYGNIWKFKNKLPLCIGTDGVVSSNSMDPIEQARLFALAGKLNGKNAEDFKLKEIWSILQNGHNALNFNTGKIKAGFAADLLLWDLKQVNTAPAHNPLAAIIYSSSKNNIIHSIVNGNFIKKNKQVLIDKMKLINNTHKIAENLISRGKGISKLIF
ncbi:MAG: amidohydrolase family protein [Pseudomonadota bacterium]